jgi:outer membrane protein assembly factor BamB
VGSFAKFANPTVADGKVFVPTWSGNLAVYGLRTSERPNHRPIIH